MMSRSVMKIGGKMNINKLIKDAHKFADKAIEDAEANAVLEWFEAEYTGKNWHKVIIVITILLALIF